MRSQSAMEYLMTYGWAILIIAVILGVLFSLGVFNPVNYAPKVPAGNCHVFRPNGPGTSFNVNLVGTCSGFLPQYVAHFNGQSSYVNITNTQILDMSGALTISAWVYSPNATYSGETGLVVNSEISTPPWSRYYLEFSWSTFGFTISNATAYSTINSATSVKNNVWYNVVATWDGTKNANGMKIYINGVLDSSGTSSISNMNGAHTEGLTLGADIKTNNRYYLNGAIADVQIYNTSLDSNEVQYLYNEGIGGAPVYLSHLVGWWPLNGDVKDYSGNGNDGTPYNMGFNGSWSSGYTSP